MTTHRYPAAVVEAVCRVMCEADGLDPDRLQFSNNCPKWMLWKDQATAALDAAFAAWEGMKLEPWWEFTTHKKRVNIILPLPKEDE